MSKAPAAQPTEAQFTLSPRMEVLEHMQTYTIVSEWRSPGENGDLRLRRLTTHWATDTAQEAILRAHAHVVTYEANANVRVVGLHSTVQL